MPVIFACPSCGQKYQVDEAMAGRRTDCRKCSAEIIIPAAVAARPATPKIRPQLQTFNEPSASRGRPPLQTFGAPARSAAPPAAAAPPSDAYEFEDVEVEEDGYVVEESDDAPMPTARPAARQAPEAPAPKKKRVQYVGIGPRFLAALIDTAVLIGVSFLVAIVIGVVAGIICASNGKDPRDPEIQRLLFFISFWSGLAVNLLYYVGMTCSSHQGTLGKMALKLRVTDLEGRRLSFGKSLGRELAKILSALPLLLGYLMAAFTAKKQALHDTLAGTLVVRRKSDLNPRRATAG